MALPPRLFQNKPRQASPPTPAGLAPAVFLSGHHAHPLISHVLLISHVPTAVQGMALSQGSLKTTPHPGSSCDLVRHP